MTQKELIILLKASNQEGLSYVYDNYSIMLFRFINSYLRDEDLSKDILQETFISLWNTRDRIIENSCVDKLLFTIAKNKSLNAIRTKNNRLKYTISEANLNENIVMEALSSCEILSFDENIDDAINRLYNSLPDIFKETFVMSRVEGLTYRQIAEKLELSPKTVEKRISKVLSILKEKTKEIYFFSLLLLGCVLF